MRLLIARTNSTRTSAQHDVPPEKLIVNNVAKKTKGRQNN